LDGHGHVCTWMKRHGSVCLRQLFRLRVFVLFVLQFAPRRLSLYVLGYWFSVLHDSMAMYLPLGVYIIIKLTGSWKHGGSEPSG
jgi:hypothetical protein